jgi:hypothetical protein
MVEIWKVIEDSKIIHTWECPECDMRTELRPSYYEERGTPSCDDCDCDMKYMKTEVNLG